MKRSEPTRLSAGVFAIKAAILRGGRFLSNLRTRVQRYPQGKPDKYPVLLAESRTPLWTATDWVENSLQFGKVQNLRKACNRLQWAEIPAGQMFSFWKQVGRASRAGGYTVGRELRQGCLIPTIGGGLCQISNGLYDLALQSGCRIVERHAHTAIVPGSAAEHGRDATVFWNYVDLRFISAQDLLITASLSADDLLLQLRGKLPHSGRYDMQSSQDLAVELDSPAAVNSCSDCGMESCFRHAPELGEKPGGHSAFLIEECWPEFDQFCREKKSEKDELLLPWRSSLFDSPQRYRWNADGYSRIFAANRATLTSSMQARFGATRSLPPIAAQVSRSRRLAACYSQQLSVSASFLYVAQTLLPFLWQAGDLGGRRFSVFLTRTPLHLLHSRLDDLASQFPEHRTFQEFRAPEWMVEAEAEALDRAESIITPHAWLAGLFPGKAQKLPWKEPRVALNARGSLLVFPGPTVARKGAYQLREAMRGRAEELLLLGNNLESPGFWDGVNTSAPESGVDWLQHAAVVVQPAFIENAPRQLLRALVAGLPVIATCECGLDPHPNLTLVEAGDTAGIERALTKAIATHSESGKEKVLR